MASTTATQDQNQAPKKTRAPRKPKTPAGAPQRPTITDQEHQELLDIRRTAMAGFAAKPQTVDAATKNKARSAVAKSRKIRNSETEVLAAWNAWEASEAERIQAEKDAKASQRKPRTRATKKAEPAPEVVENKDEEAPLVEAEEENEVKAA